MTQATNYTNADLPALDTLLNGTVVKVPGPGWSARKEEIAVLLQRCATSFLVTVVFNAHVDVVMLPDVS